MNSESEIRHTLKRLSGQRVALVLQPGNVWVIDNAVEDTEKTDAALKTAFMRGWVEPIQNGIPRGKLNPDGSLPTERPLFEGTGPIWRLTDGGWAIVNRTHGWSVFAIVVSALSFAVSILSLVISFRAAPQ